MHGFFRGRNDDAQCEDYVNAIDAMMVAPFLVTSLEECSSIPFVGADKFGRIVVAAASGNVPDILIASHCVFEV